jgi:hypothetical protein
MIDLRADRGASGWGLVWLLDEAPVAKAPAPVVVDSLHPAGAREGRVAVGYDDVTATGDDLLIGTALVRADHGVHCRVEDTWSRVAADEWRVDRSLAVNDAPSDGAGVRLVLEVLPTVDATCEDFRFFAPGAMYDLNDLDGDHVDDYAGTQTLFYRDDRLSALSILAYEPRSGLAWAVSRADPPEFDPPPDRVRGQRRFLQRTDIGSLGLEPVAAGGCRLSAAYPFVEPDGTHALVVRTRPGWGAYWPAVQGELLTVSYGLAVRPASTPHDALRDAWRARVAQLRPRPVELTAPLQVITDARIDALLPYYARSATTTAAGFVTNCHPQDGRQLSNVIQYGFTGQNLLNACCLLRAVDRADAQENRLRALSVVDFYVEDALRNPGGLVHGLYDLDRERYDSWWTGLLLPLAYADPGEDLEALMGPLHEHLRPVIEALTGRDGTYLRCLAEEYDALLLAVELERAQGVEHPGWLDAAGRFARFLADAQREDGAWYRAYDLEGRPLTEPDFWFGQTDVQRTSSTATVVPFLLKLYALTGADEWLGVARRATDFAYTTFVDGLKFNGGIHDSMYARPQLVDHESIIFAFRAQLEMHRATGERTYLERATVGAWLVCSWVWLWDVPLPEGSTLAEHGFRSTGWPGCDAPGAGYVHPMGVIAVPDLVELARLGADEGFVEMAALLLNACNENVALPGKDWGYARPGLQEEGVLISWCWADDSMFVGTEFGGRGKGEGNKTCFPWISAVTIWTHQELMARYGTDDLHAAVLDAQKEHDEVQ